MNKINAYREETIYVNRDIKNSLKVTRNCSRILLIGSKNKIPKSMFLHFYLT